MKNHPEKFTLVLEQDQDDVPTYPMSPSTEMTALNALAEHRRGNTKKLGNVKLSLKR